MQRPLHAPEVQGIFWSAAVGVYLPNNAAPPQFCRPGQLEVNFVAVPDTETSRKNSSHLRSVSSRTFFSLGPHWHHDGPTSRLRPSIR